jgi:hypothetical protein
MLNPTLDPQRIAPIYGQHRALSIPNALSDEVANELYSALLGLDWVLEINDYNPTPRMRVPLNSIADRNASLLNVLDEIPNEIQRDKLFYMRLNVDSLDFRHPSLTRFVEYLNSAAFLASMRVITGIPELTHCWAEATCYTSCCFLGGHRDDHHKNNRVAFVFNLTRKWQLDWGGLLMLTNPNMHPVIVPPLWNSLSLFTVPRDHLVSAVSPAATENRYSITGWLRD